MGRSYSQNGGDPQVFQGAEQLETFLCPALQANVNNYQVPNRGFFNASQLLIGATAAVSITGLVGGVPNRQVVLLNITPHAITLDDTSGSSAAGNKFFLGGVNIILAQWQAAVLIWSQQANAWVTAGAGGGGGGGAPVNDTYVTETDESASLPNSVTAKGALIRKATDQAIVSGTRTAITFDTVLFDTTSFFNIADPTRLTAPAAGIYTMQASGVWGQGGAGFAGLQFAINGDLTTIYGTNYVPFGQFVDPAPDAVITLELAANDYVEVYGFQSSGGPVSVLATSNAEACTFSMVRVH